MARPSDERLTELEVQLAHAQRLLEQINDVVTQQAGQIDRMTLAMKKLTESVDDLKHKSDEKRSLQDEKPPHY